MIRSYIIGILAIVSMMLAWALVQSWWRRTFSDELDDEDVLAGRSDCSGCGCMTVCKRNGKRLSTNETN